MSDNGFATLGLGQTLEATLASQGLTEPTPVQLQSIPMLLEGADLIASAPTGTGKTAAFLLPALVRLSQPPKTKSIGPRVLVLTPTRELAQQVANAAKQFSRQLNRVKTICVTGGESYREQNKAISTPHEIMVATPGRLMDQMQSGRLDFSRLEVLVLDEADRMLDMGFSEDVMTIASKLPSDRQTVCFTATMSRTVLQLSQQLQKNPKTLEVKAEVARTEAIDQHVIFVDNFGHKRRLLSHWLNGEASGQAVIFTSTKRSADELAAALDAEGHATAALHGDLQQRQRTRMLNQLRRGEVRVLVATDVAARGIDVPAITHVFNFDLPRFAEDYVHRIGRTGRAGANGTAVSFVGRDDVGALRGIERFIGRPVKISEVEGMVAEFKPGARGDGRRPAPRKWDERRPQGERREGRPFGDRNFGDRRPQSGERSFGDRRPVGGETRSFGDRAPRGENFGNSERPASRDGYPKREGFSRDNAAPRTFSDRPREQAAPYGDRPQRDARPSGDRSFGDRRPDAPRKTWGDSKPFGSSSERPRRKFD
jgi:superfamily II DNA/RNA helicase